MWYLWSCRQERLYVDAGVVHLQVVVPQAPGHSNSCHNPGLGGKAEGREKHSHRQRKGSHYHAAAWAEREAITFQFLLPLSVPLATNV